MASSTTTCETCNPVLGEDRLAAPGNRLVAIDAVRGLAMANIVLVRPLIPSAAILPSGPLRDFLNHHLHHSAWNGLTETDVTFAAFVMLLGTMIPISLRRYRHSSEGRGEVYLKILRRSVV